MDPLTTTIQVVGTVLGEAVVVGVVEGVVDGADVGRSVVGDLVHSPYLGTEHRIIEVSYSAFSVQDSSRNKSIVASFFARPPKLEVCDAGQTLARAPQRQSPRKSQCRCESQSARDELR